MTRRDKNRREGNVIAIVLWRRLDVPGHEVARLALREDGWELSGTAVFSHKRRPCKLDYRVVCARDWQTQAAQIIGFAGDREVNIHVLVDRKRNWYLNQAPCPAVAGCLDIDLGFSPATNLLPIRRLSLKRGQDAKVRAAWLPFPSFKLQLLPQVYRREGQFTYRYESGGGTFVRSLKVSATGFVTEYPRLWLAESKLSSRRNLRHAE